MNNNVSKVLFGCIASTLLVACGGGGSSKAQSISTYNGNWKTSPACMYDADDNIAIKMTINIMGSSLVATGYGYNTSDCSDVSFFKTISNYSLKYGDDKTNASSICSNTKEVDITLTGGSINGITKTAQEISAISNEPIKRYDLICTSGNNLYGGDGSTKDGTSPANRPTQIDDTDALIK